MAIVLLKGYVDDESADVIEGRPDFQNPDFGVTEASGHPPYVFSVRGVSCLVHKIARVRLHWYRVARSGSALVKMKHPAMCAVTHCQQWFYLKGESSRTCYVPNPDALLCGRCHGEGATFPKAGRAYKSGLSRQEAHVKLGCVVQGY